MPPKLPQSRNVFRGVLKIILFVCEQFFEPTSSRSLFGFLKIGINFRIIEEMEYDAIFNSYFL